MSIFASQTSATIALPMDIPHTVTIRKLTARETETAQAVSALSITNGRVSTFSQRLRRILAEDATEADASAVLVDPLLGYDRYEVVSAGLMAWTYPQEITPEILKDIDDNAIEFIASE